MTIFGIVRWVFAGLTLIGLIVVGFLLTLNSYRIVDEVNKGGGAKIIPLTRWDFWRARTLYAERSPNAPLLKRERLLMILVAGLWILLLLLVGIVA